MKKIIISIMLVLGTAGAYAANENAATSKEYVDTAIAAKQPTIPAEGANVVMTFDSTADNGIGTKQIYDETASYVSQETALVTAQTANGAVQMALNGELTCQEYSTIDPTDCWLWNLNSVPERQLPAGYTALPYLESTGKQYLDLGQPIGSGENITVKFAFTENVAAPWFGAMAQNTSPHNTPGFHFTYLYNAFQIEIFAKNIADGGYYGSEQNCTPYVPYILHWYGNPLKMPTLSPEIMLKNYNVTDATYLYTPPRNANLFRRAPQNSVRPMRIYYFTVEGKMNLIPARRDSDGELGMYDTVTGTFFTNAGTGKFISGVYTEHVN